MCLFTINSVLIKVFNYKLNDCYSFRPQKMRNNLMYMKELLLCTKCDKYKNKDDFHEQKNVRKRRYHCKECRSTNRPNEYWHKLFKRFKRLCSNCQNPAKIIANGKCKKCLMEQGIKICRTCKNAKLLHMEFYPKKADCKECLRND